MRIQFTVFSLFSLVTILSGKCGELEFNRDIRPILSDKCFKCHGPDAKNQKSDFRVDSFANATKDLGDYAGVVPGDLKKSEIHWRLHSTDPDDMMPPADAKMALTKKEIATIDQWIEEGAQYQEHWSFIPVPEIVPAPETKTTWGYNEIDDFILARLEKEEFSPSPEASREKWLRRVTFDLTGLPPTLEEIDNFLADESTRAYKSVVERLFATDAYAERMTTEWMDVARYSDSYGFQVDRDRFVWPWRDWVIRKFRENQPYDQFIIEQVAGDLLPNATRDQVLATTFSRLHAQKVEGGSVPEEFRIEYVSDRLHTYGTAFLGLTMECCRCHDHKYDPLATKEYYEMSAFFANIDESGLYSFFTPSIPTPTLWLPEGSQEEDLKKLETEIQAAQKKLEVIGNSAQADFDKWLTSAKPDQLKPGHALASFSFDNPEKGGKYPNLAGKTKPASTNGNNKEVTGKKGKGIHLTGDDALTLPVGNFSRDEAFSVSLWLNTPNKKNRAVIFSRSKAWTDAASRGYELLLEKGKLSAALIHFYPGNAIRILAREELPVKSWQHVTMTYDGSSKAAGLSLYVNGKRIETETVRDKLTREITGGGSDTIVFGQRMRDNGFKNGLVDELHVFERSLSPAEVAALHSDKEIAAKDSLPYFLNTAHKPWQDQNSALIALRKKRSALVKKIKEIMVMAKKKEPRQSYLLERGSYATRGEPVTPGVPAALPEFPEGQSRDRLGLAKWTASPDNPLTARVAVNRYWQMLFGNGLVETPEDFGSQGRLPTHPDLLNWLTREFLKSGWDVQHLLTQMVLSATYRQTSVLTSGEIAERDPENKLLSRFPSNRLTAEMIRDNALAVSGLLVNKVGGASVKPYEVSVSFKPSKPSTGEGLYRRSLYTYWKQTAPAPMMTTLDASKRDVCRVRREKTDSPLQGLVLLNSPQFIEAARVYAGNLVSRHGDNSDAIIEEAFRALTSRKPDDQEWPILRKLLSEQRQIFSDKPEEVKALLSNGDKPTDENQHTPDLAAATILVSSLMNFDECITKR